ncbi:YdcH family protein [Parasphingorhabdus sp.]|uniref:YdcH family protein n=1 Tax=Parasphingorhabdus sp. TaxID=2709688 RepID=UPI003BB09F11
MRKYLNSLIRKHRKLDKQISQARWDENQLRAMKKLRLTLKDNISQLQKGAMRTSV